MVYADRFTELIRSVLFTDKDFRRLYLLLLDLVKINPNNKFFLEGEYQEENINHALFKISEGINTNVIVNVKNTFGLHGYDNEKLRFLINTHGLMNNFILLSELHAFILLVNENIRYFHLREELGISYFLSPWVTKGFNVKTVPDADPKEEYGYLFEYFKTFRLNKLIGL